MKKFIAFLIVFLSLSTNFCWAQQTIFNVPSADVTPKGKFYAEQFSLARPWNPNAFWGSTNYGAYGIGKNTEIDVTLYNVGAPSTNNISLGTGFKSAIPIVKLKDKYPEREYKFTIGSQVVAGLEGQGTGNWTYAHLSGRLPVTKTRLTGGVSYSTKQVYGNDTTCFIGGIEQPVTKKLTLMTDWYSGKGHYAGAIITGLSYALPKNTTLFLGYQIPNNSQDVPSCFVIELAKIF